MIEAVIDKMPSGIVYLACPYTHADPYVREDRFLLSCKACAFAMKEWGINMTSAIVFTHPLVTRYPMPVEWEFWAKYDEVVINVCEELWVLCVPGFTNSVGTNAEIKIARDKGMRIRYMVPTETGFVVTEICPREENLYGKTMQGRLSEEKPSI